MAYGVDPYQHTFERIYSEAPTGFSNGFNYVKINRELSDFLTKHPEIAREMRGESDPERHAKNQQAAYFVADRDYTGDSTPVGNVVFNNKSLYL